MVELIIRFCLFLVFLTAFKHIMVNLFLDKYTVPYYLLVCYASSLL